MPSLCRQLPQLKIFILWIVFVLAVLHFVIAVYGLQHPVSST